MLNPKEKWDKSLFAELKKRWDNGELPKATIVTLKISSTNLRSEIAKSFTSDKLLIALQSSRSDEIALKHSTLTYLRETAFTQVVRGYGLGLD